MRCAFACVLVAACNAKSNPPPAGDPDADCDTPDTDCPDSRPHLASSCDGDLSCVYEDEGTWEYGCHGGLWWIDDAYDCASRAGCVPEMTETCEDPSSAPIAGATLEIGPVERGPFRAFAGESVGLIWGSQGSPMIGIRIRVAGTEAPPGCVVARLTLEDAGGAGPGEATIDRVLLRCGQSSSLFAIVPDDGNLGCMEAAGELDLEVLVEVEGIGAASATVPVAYGEYENCYG
jgi:hypothetical protein